jgi:hypothetical protein
MVVEHLFERQRSVALAGLALAARAEHEAADSIEHASQLQRRHHAVHAVDVFAHVLEEQDRSIPFRQE